MKHGELGGLFCSTVCVTQAQGLRRMVQGKSVPSEVVKGNEVSQLKPTPSCSCGQQNELTRPDVLAVLFHKA